MGPDHSTVLHMRPYALLLLAACTPEVKAAEPPCEDPFLHFQPTYADGLAEGAKRAAEQLGDQVFLVNIDNGVVEPLAVFPKREWCLAVRNSIRNDSKTATRWTWECVNANP